MSRRKEYATRTRICRHSLTQFLAVSCVLLAGFSGPTVLRAETPAEHDQRMAWWREARFGMFIHWGIMSIPGKDFNAMEKDKIPRTEYEKLVAQYNPVKWNAHDVVKMAKDAGQKYLVFVAKHHDGFAMWDSKCSDYNIMHSPYRQDIVRQLADECAQQGVVFCFYYSILDWHHPDANKERWPKYVEYMKTQLRELLTGYGPIGVVWFDGDWIPEWTDDQGRDLAQFVWSLQPKTIINNRIGKGRQDNSINVKKEAYGADFGTPEQEVPPNGLPSYDWESCMTINNSWSWNRSDVQHKSPPECLRLLVDTVSKGGNLLLNIGPHPDGSILEPQQNALRGIAEWMRINSESIHGTTASPFAQALPWGRCTRKSLADGKTRLYLHVFDWPKDGRLVVPRLVNSPAKAYLLADPQRAALACDHDAKGLTIALPAAPLDPNVSVVVLEVEGDLKIVSP
jgi:alpha-L-fucosidase